MYKIAFNDRIDYEYCCDNYIYNCKDIRQISVLETCNMTAKLGMIYTGTVKYSNLWFFSKR